MTQPKPTRRLALTGLLILILVSLAWDAEPIRASASPATPRHEQGDSDTQADPDPNAVSIGDANAPNQLDLYADPMCNVTGLMIQTIGAQIGQKVSAGRLHINLYLVDDMTKLSASGTYSDRAIVAVHVVAQGSSSDATWMYVRGIYGRLVQPRVGGYSDLTDDQLATLATRQGVSSETADRIRSGEGSGDFNPYSIASANLERLQQYPNPVTPYLVLNGTVIDFTSDWLTSL